MKVRINDIYVGDRIREDMGDIREMAQDLLENGQITAITVRSPIESDDVDELYTGQKYVLVAGGRRLAAAMSIGWKEIEAYLREDEVDQQKHVVLELHENLRRKQMTFDEEAKAKKRLLELRQEMDPNVTAAIVAREIGETPANFSRSITAARALEADPSLASAGSVKAVIRAKNLTDELKARALKSTNDSELIKKLNLDARIVTDDARRWIRTLDTGLASLAIADPPYGVRYWSAGQKVPKGRSTKSLSKYDDSPEYAADLITDLLPEMVRITKVDGWVVIFGNYDSYQFTRALVEDCCAIHFDYREESTNKHCMSAPDQEAQVSGCRFLKPAHSPWIWYRPNSQNSPRYPDLHAKSMYEYILVVNRGAATLKAPNGKTQPHNVLVYDSEYGDDRVHANQKPFALMGELVEIFTSLGDVVVDPCYGSGTSLAAAASKARYIYGADSNPAMLGPAKGLVARHLVPMGAIQEGRQRPVILIPEEKLTEPDEISTLPLEIKNVEGEVYYVDEAGRVKDGESVYAIAYVKNEVATVYASKKNTPAEAYDDAQGVADVLNELGEAGLINRASLRQEDVAEALVRYEEWMKEEINAAD